MSEPHQAEPWGRNGLMALAAVRYCTGRMSYIVRDCVDWLFQVWSEFPEPVQALIAREIDEALAQDATGRGNGVSNPRLGMLCDRAEWLRAQTLWGGPAEDQ